MCPDIEKIASQLLDHERVTDQEQSHFTAHLQECVACQKDYDEWRTTTCQVRRALASKGHEHPGTETLLLYADHQIVGARRMQIEFHLMACTACREDLALLQQLDSMQSTFSLPMQRTGILFEKLQRWLDKIVSGLVFSFSRTTRYATAVLIIAMTAGLYYIMHRPEHQAPSSAQTAIDQIRPDIPAVSIPVKTETSLSWADRFKPLPHLEEMIGVSLRSESIIVTAPAMDTLRSRDIVFQWQGGAGSLFLKIIDNREKTVFQSAPVQNGYRYHAGLMPGLYYWKLEDEEETLWVGKFYISPSMTD